METCNCGKLKEEMLQDRIVVRIRDKALSEKLQMDESQQEFHFQDERTLSGKVISSSKANREERETLME